MDAILMIPSDSDKRVRFYFDDGSYITVHTLNGELRACGSDPLVASNRHPDVIAVNQNEFADFWREE